MLLEDFLGHSNNLRYPLKEFPNRIASRNKRTASDEIKVLKKLTLKDMPRYLLIPSISRTNVKERQVLENNHRNMGKDTLKRIRNILKFYSKYYRVYVKYKHILPAVLGVHHKKYNAGQTEVSNSFIYIRDYYDFNNKRGKTSPRRNKFYTYIVLASGLEPLNLLRNCNG